MDTHAADADTIEENDALTPGTRVALRGNPIGVTVDRPTGTIVEPDIWEGYYRIRLDVPARYHHADGHTEPLAVIREAGDNLVILPPLAR
ncbi:MAG: hypothetical protein ACR2JW_10715 [Thermomicrobiales bacterium]